MLPNNVQTLNENLGIIFRDKGSIQHSKSINKILLHDEDTFFTGGRDSMIKLWENKENGENYELMYNFEGHVDWINDMAINRKRNLLFSCSNDKNINIWRIPERGIEINNLDKVGRGVDIMTPTYSIHQYHKDYIKSLCYKEGLNYLYACGYDGVITGHNIEEYGKTNSIKLNADNYLYKSTNNNSIYSIDCDEKGNLLLASVYENQIIGIDVRQKKEIFHLRGHKDIVRSVKLSADGKIGLSISSDKTAKLWDMHTHKVLKNWDFYQDSVQSVCINDTFTKMLTGSRNGDLYLTDIPRSCFCKIDNLREPVISLAMSNSKDRNKEINIFASTAGNKLYEYKFSVGGCKSIKKEKEKSLQNSPNSKKINKNTVEHKSPINSISEHFKGYLYEFNNEIIKFHLMKNKIYVLCATKNKLMLYNIMRLRKIAEFQLTNNLTFEKMIEILDKFDQNTLKTWFIIDIKLGVLTVTFKNENLFNNQYNFDDEYLEKVIDKTNSFTKSVPIDFKFLKDDSSLNNSSINNHTMSMNMTSNVGKKSSYDKNDKQAYLSSTTLSVNRKNQMSLTLDKSTTSGYSLVKVIFENLYSNVLNKYLSFYEENFWDTRDYLKSELMKTGSKSNIEVNLNQTQGKVKSLTSNINFFIYSVIENQIHCGPYSDDLNSDEFKLPLFIKDILPIPNLKIPQVNPQKKEKIEVIIDNKRGDIKNNNKNNDIDELEAYGYITVENFRNWLLKSYIDIEDLKNSSIREDLSSLNTNEKIIKHILDRYVNDPAFFPNFIDFYLHSGVFVKNPQITILQLKGILYPNKTLTISLRYASIPTLVERGVIKLPK